MSADNVHATKGERMYDTGSTTFMLICTMLVFLMTPGLAFFYGGLSRRKNVINTMLMCFGAIGLVGVLWIVAGWSLAYGGDGSSPFIGGLDQLLCLPVLNQVLQAAEGSSQLSIRRAVLEAEVQDVILLAGKGHEPYQEIAGVRRPFSDIDEARAALAARVEEQQ